jgi:hypothetical protein
MRHGLLLCLLLVAFLGCVDKRTWLSEEIKRVVPYEEGQKLVFQSSTGLKDSMLITKIESGLFSDAIGAPTNERMAVTASTSPRNVRSRTQKVILHLSAQDGETRETIQFELSLRETFMYVYGMAYKDFEVHEPIVVESQHARYDDVIKVALPEKVNVEDQAIRELYWSKSAGYVRLVQSDGTVWDLSKSTYR